MTLMIQATVPHGEFDGSMPIGAWRRRFAVLNGTHQVMVPAGSGVTTLSSRTRWTEPSTAGASRYAQVQQCIFQTPRHTTTPARG